MAKLSMAYCPTPVNGWMDSRVRFSKVVGRDFLGDFVGAMIGDQGTGAVSPSSLTSDRLKMDSAYCLEKRIKREDRVSPRPRLVIISSSSALSAVKSGHTSNSQLYIRGARRAKATTYPSLDLLGWAISRGSARRSVELLGRWSRSRDRS